MYRKDGDLLVVAGLALAAAVLGPLQVPGLDVLLGLGLVFVLPGYALVSALFPTWPLWTAERGALVVGSSLALAALAGFLLDVTPWGLQTASGALLLGLLTLVLTAGALRRRLRSAGVTPAAPTPAPARSVRIVPVTLLALGLGLVVLAVAVARAGALAQPQDAFTDLWMLPGPPGSLQIGIHSSEHQPVTYRLQMLLGADPLREWPAITLQPGAQWSGTVAVPAGAAATRPVSALLYRQDAPQRVYRRVLWVPPPAPGTTPASPDLWPTVPAPPGAPTPSPSGARGPEVNPKRLCHVGQRSVTA